MRWGDVMTDLRRTTVVVSAAAALLAGGFSALHASASPLHLTGQGSGTWKVQPSNPDTGTQRLLHGRGSFSIGTAKIRGSVNSPGFIANGDCSVTIRLVTGNGSITLAGHSKHTSSSYPTCIGPVDFHFHTTKTTGGLSGKSYKGLGHIDLVEHSTTTTDHGTFKMKLRQLTS